ncbi:hypothetical protein OV142_30445 [Nannocystis sp. SCPEA4]|nr:hypothetical protein [Nannocystis sp. SCPEA4]
MSVSRLTADSGCACASDPLRTRGPGHAPALASLALLRRRGRSAMKTP